MPTGVPAIDALFQLGRGITAIPEGIRQEGASGAFRSFLNPRPFEVTARARGHREDAAAELQQIEQIGDQAQSITDIAPAFGMIQSLRGQLEATGADAATLEQTLSPTFRKISSKAFQLIDAGDESAPLKLSQLGLIAGDVGTAKLARSVQELFTSRQNMQTRRATEKLQEAKTTTEERLRQPRQGLLEARAGYYSRGGRAGAEPFAVKTGDIDRLQGQADRILARLNGREAQEGNAQDAGQLDVVLSELNRRRGLAGLGPLMVTGDQPGRFALAEAPPQEQQGGGVPYGPDIGAGGFSLQGVGEIPEGGVILPAEQQRQMALQQASQQAAQPQPAPSPPPGSLPRGGFAVGPSPVAPPFVGSAEAQPAPLPEPMQQRPIPSGPPSVPIPIQIRERLGRGEQVRTSELVAYYEQFMPRDQAMAVARQRLLELQQGQ